MFKSTQVALGESNQLGDDLFAADSGGRVRSSFFSFTTKEDIAKGESIHLASLNPGTIRVQGRISHIDVSKGKFSLGHLDYLDHVGDTTSMDVKAFDTEVSSGPILSKVKPSNSLGIRSQTGVRVIATAIAAVKGGTSIEGVIYYTGN